MNCTHAGTVMYQAFYQIQDGPFKCFEDSYMYLKRCLALIQQTVLCLSIAQKFDLPMTIPVNISDETANPVKIQEFSFECHMRPLCDLVVIITVKILEHLLMYFLIKLHRVC